MKDSDYDLCIIGGGINGAGIARDAAGRGLKVLLLEQGDLAQATSSASTKLVHGGLRYLEFYEFGLVRDSLKEREVLLNLAPNIIWPLTFVLPHHNKIRPLWLIRIGLFLYDFLAGKKKLQSSKILNLKTHTFGHPLRNEFRKGFSYSDCWVQDSRLVVLNAMDAKSMGTDILTYTKCTKVEQVNDVWSVNYQCMKTGEEKTIRASSLINAAGPWGEKLLQDNAFYENDKALPHLKLVKGSHIIVPQQYKGEHCYILQQKDGRIVFAIPYEEDFTLIGTTDEAFENDASEAEISEDEIKYLCASYNEFFEKKIEPSDIVSTYSGVRALFDDGESEERAITRDYRIYHHENYAAPMISIFGGKITTYRKLAEKAVDQLMALINNDSKSWTASKKLPGGDVEDHASFIKSYKEKHPWLTDAMLERFVKHYGSLADLILENATSLKDLGEHYGCDVYEAEIDYLINHEFAVEPDDILHRRTKLALHIDQDTAQKIKRAISQKTGVKDE